MKPDTRNLIEQVEKSISGRKRKMFMALAVVFVMSQILIWTVRIPEPSVQLGAWTLATLVAIGVIQSVMHRQSVKNERRLLEHLKDFTRERGNDTGVAT